MFVGVFSITGTGTVDTGLSVIEEGSTHATVVNAATAIPTETASITSVAAPSIKLVVIEHRATANVISGTAKSVAVQALGY